LVGGAVRNALMQRPVSDHDIATTAPPEIVMARAQAAGLKVKPTGIAHGTVTVLVGRQPFEVTTLREDIETDGRHAVVCFGRDFAQDALRRDFTINALSLSRDGTIHDYAGGLDDLARRRVRFIGDPATRIREDYLRILRFFRFSAEYGEGPLDADGLAAAIALRDGLARLSRERVRVELLKLLVARRAAEVTAEIAGTGLLGPLLRSVPQPRRLAAAVALVPEADAMLRLAALAAIVPEDAARLQELLRLSNAEAARLDGATRVLTRLHVSREPPPRDTIRGLLFTFGRAAVADGAVLAAAQSGDGAMWSRALDDVATVAVPVLPFGADDLIARGLAPGRALGEALRRLSALWQAAGFPNDKSTQEALLEKVVATAVDDR
ncbi:MAG: CCA tRNA nucleotidyltransferase, partial [Beijerinckiaceae bacterium]|nr:CCA tRNA nucleotidyltransferase [Beijerinckiaceae bacterium]